MATAKWLVLLAAGLLQAGEVGAAPREYRIDPVHSRVLFLVDHLGYAKAMGTFSRPSGWLRFDPRDWSTAAAEVEIDLRSLDLGDAEWNARMARRDGFNSVEYPVARWRSGRIEALDRERFIAHGRLAYRGNDYPLSLEVRFNRLAPHPLTLRRTAGFSASASLPRSSLGLFAWKNLVGEQVELRIEVEAQRARAGDPAAGDTDDNTGEPDDEAA